MTLFEILLMSIGALIFVVSFFIPDKKGKEGGHLGVQITEEQIKKLVEKEIEASRDKIIDMVDESVTYGMERTERAMERVSNEKIMAVSEYSDTVLNTIHKNHEEAVFLYDMLNDKHTNLKTTAADVENAAKEAKQILPTLEQYTDRLEKHEKDMKASNSFLEFDNNSFDRINLINPEPVPQYDDYAKSQVTLEMEREAARRKQAAILEQLANATSASDIDMNGGKPKKKVAPLQPVGRQAVLQELTDNAIGEKNLDAEFTNGSAVDGAAIAGTSLPGVSTAGTAMTAAQVNDFAGSDLKELRAEDYADILNGANEVGKSFVQQAAEAQSFLENQASSAKMPVKASNRNERPTERPAVKSEPEISFGRAQSTSSVNSNERILALHKLGKSNMAIAKELGLGVGEVNLVLGLFKG